MNFNYTYGDKRYHTWNYHLKNRFGHKVFKVSLNASFTCPNKTGDAGYGGCTFCSRVGSGDFAGDVKDDLITQFENIKEMMHQKWPEAKYIGYFQANTNTYAPVPELREKYEQILNHDSNIVGLSISTRPDCLPDDVVDYLADLNKRTNLWVELGLQSIHQKAADYINRGHDYQTFVDGVNKLRAKGIDVVVHIINGLPFETQEMMLETARAVSKLDIQGLKIHLLHVIKYTRMAKQYKKGEFELMAKDDYVDTVVKQLEILPPEVVIHRLTGDAVREDLIGPMWSLKKWEVLNAIDDELKKRDTYQGKYYKQYSTSI
ncbi:TIGR01212 family radical SAM protein [Haloplasma contractile]|uniref:tRNA dimethylallyltransferase protein n=1 Tax=Haloplasma contractile SSD-17B TaxID=1033810 RepID=U2EFF0_9MOLU|nr:TIGR01212 family radical SAM protein [Haloplasma contractile]ERJ13396.1 tRNA dimethylallyltransferase protein [Haloplasma contractile SSD-17B]